MSKGVEISEIGVGIAVALLGIHLVLVHHALPSLPHPYHFEAPPHPDHPQPPLEATPPLK